MPTYAYACKSCAHAFDIQQSFADAPLTVCPECGGDLRKHYGSIGVTFNGAGFYRTDSRNSAGTPSQTSTSSNKESTASAAPAAASSPASS